jgi:8-oxo-dGTP diphosphatase
VPATGPTVHVVAGALFDAEGRVLLAQRPEGKHMAGGWEFPGGKVDPGETPLQALKRELHEELGIEAHSARPLIAYEHPYPHRTVLLDLWHVTEYSGEPRPLEGQPLQWVPVDALDSVGLLAADAPMVPAIRKIVGR